MGFLAPLFFLSYGFANEMAAARGVTRSLVFAWERHIPFWPWTIVPYWSIDLLYGLSFLTLASLRKWITRRRLLTAQLVSTLAFLLPLRFSFAPPRTEGAFGRLFEALHAFDLPYNQAPSLHISLLVILWHAFGRATSRPLYRLLIHAWAMCIALSVLTTWQHHFFDVPTGAAVGFFCLWLWPDGEHRSPLIRAPQAHWGRLPAIYLAAGAGLLAAGIAGGGWALWLAWPALALTLVGWNYIWAGGSGFQKSQGQHSLAVRVLFAPYLLGSRLNAWLWNRNDPGPVHVSGGVWLGALSSAKDKPGRGFATLLDLTGELPAPKGPWWYENYPWMDLVAPTPQNLRALADRIEERRQSGDILVACALGCSRSACAVSAWLLIHGGAQSVEEATASVRALRPRVVLGPGLCAALARCAAVAPLREQSTRHPLVPSL
ncbi:MAG: phosphatase PAP2/dual specificity phosphatase family protein [Planctomycetota bacterium]